MNIELRAESNVFSNEAFKFKLNLKLRRRLGLLLLLVKLHLQVQVRHDRNPVTLPPLSTVLLDEINNP